MTRTTCCPARLLAIVFSLAVAIPVSAQQDQLSADQQQAIKQIDLNRIKTTISFLASDELKGRDTPSPELDIAAAYVAARFRGAGLKGLGPNGSFYQTTEIATLQRPATASVKSNGQAVNVLGVLSANNEPFEYSGPTIKVGDDMPDELDGMAVVQAEPFNDRRASFMFMRKMITLQQAGATGVLVEVDPGHPLIAQAAAATQPRLVRTRGGLVGPVILVQSGKVDAEVAISLDAQKTGQAEVRNVIGVLEGSDPELSKEAIIFSAHLDHIGETSGAGDTINNGADDDATGVTAVLTLADAYAALEQKPKRSVIFMTFWGEEKGLLGSKYYADHPRWPLNKTVANINLEMLGRPESGAAEKTWVTGWDQSDLGPLMKQGADRVGVLVFEHPQFSAMLYRQSDNFSFVGKGVIAHSFSAGSLHEDYHQPSDEWEKLELRHMQRVIEGLFAGSLPIADGEVTPKRSPNAR